MSPHDHTLDPSDGASVVADIGGDVGALVLTTGPEGCGTEIDIEPAGRADRRTHVAVRERRLPSGPVYAAFYPALAAGEYTLLLPDGPRPVTITGGAVTQVAWAVAVV